MNQNLSHRWEYIVKVIQHSRVHFLNRYRGGDHIINVCLDGVQAVGEELGQPSLLALAFCVNSMVRIFEGNC